MSDGIVSDSPNQMEQAATTLKTVGVKVKFIVPGTATGTYKYKPSAPSTPSSEQSISFDNFGASNITQPQTVKATIQAVEQSIVNGKTYHEQQKSYLPLALGGVLALVGLFKDRKQRRTRYI